MGAVTELTPTMVKPLVLRALDDLGGRARRRDIVQRSVELGGFSAAQVAVRRTYKQSSYPGHLHTICDYAVWYLRDQKGLLHAPERGIYVFTAAGRAAVRTAGPGQRDPRALLDTLDGPNVAADGDEGGVRWWLKLGYFTAAPQSRARYWLERDWISDGPGRKSRRWRGRGKPRTGQTYPAFGPQYKVGDRLVMYITRRGVCPAIFEVVDEPRWDPGHVDRQSGGREGDQWGVVTNIKGLWALPLDRAPEVESIGVAKSSLLNKGHKVLEEWQYEYAERLIRGRQDGRKPRRPRRGSSRDVSVEKGETEGYAVMSAKGVRRARRREAQLVHDFRTFLEAQGNTIKRKELRPPGTTHALHNDIFNKTRNQLIEAKASSTRGDIRMAIGQLADYSRFVQGSPRQAVLLEAKPHPDLLDLLRSRGIGAIWRSGDTFHDDAGGEFT